MRTLWQDIRYGFRMLVRNPGFTAVAVVSLAVGIGLTATTFSLMDWLCLRPLPVAHPRQLFRVFASTDQYLYGSFSYPDYIELRNRCRAFSGPPARANYQQRSGRAGRRGNAKGSRGLTVPSAVRNPSSSSKTPR